MDAAEIARTLQRMAHQIVERNGSQGVATLALVGIYTRGVEVARRLADLIEGSEGARARRSGHSTFPCTGTTCADAPG